MNQKLMQCGFYGAGESHHYLEKIKQQLFERYFIEEEQTHVEVENPYYKWAEDEAFCDKILDEFNIKDSEGKIINGHVILNPKTQTPIKANGKLIIINGGLTKRYKNKTMDNKTCF